jgi:excisionase family DNA binding protein
MDAGKIVENAIRDGLRPGEFITVSDAADILKIHEKTAYALIRDGKLEATRIGHKRGIRIDRRSVTDYQKKEWKNETITTNAEDEVVKNDGAGCHQKTGRGEICRPRCSRNTGCGCSCQNDCAGR